MIRQGEGEEPSIKAILPQIHGVFLRSDHREGPGFLQDFLLMGWEWADGSLESPRPVLDLGLSPVLGILFP